LLRRIAVIGHSLAAEENRLAFAGWPTHQVHLIVPRIWKAPGLGHIYRIREPHPTLAGGPALHPLAVLASGRNSLFAWIGLGPLLRRIRPDLIYCWEEPWCLATWQVGRLARGLGVPMVFFSAENRPKTLRWPFTRLLRGAFTSSPAAIVPTPEIAARLRSWGFRGGITVIPLWIRPGKDLAAREENKQLAFVGRLIPLKRADLVVESLAHLPEFRLRIIGDGPEGPRLRALADALGLASRVDFRGHVENGELDSALAGASLLIMPTGENPRQAEQFGKAALEAVTLGLPVLASRTGNLAALAAGFSTIRAGDFTTPAELAEAVRAIFRAYPAADDLAASRRLAEELYGPSAVARSLEAAFSAAAANGGGT